MSVLHVLIFLFWKPFDFCPVIFFGPKLISSLFLKKQGSSLFLLPPPPGGGGGGGGRGARSWPESLPILEGQREKYKKRLGYI